MQYVVANSDYNDNVGHTCVKFKGQMGQVRFLHGIQVAQAGYRYEPLGLVPHLGEAHRQI